MKTAPAIDWLKRNLFYSAPSGVASLLLLAFILWVLWHGLTWGILDATFVGNQETCQTHYNGACWAFIIDSFPAFIYGFFEVEERWRVNIVLFLFFASVIWVLTPRAPWRKQVGIWLLLIYPFIALWLLKGGFGLSPIPTRSWGGFTLTLVIAVTGIAFSLPIGIALALGRRSQIPIIHSLSVLIIEFCRGVPFITVLFMSAYLLPYFLPPGNPIDNLSRALIGATIFTAAYVAETIRGGLQALPRGQYEAAQALGLGYWKLQRLVILPQALRIVIPSIMNSYISFFKDTTLVTIIALLDFLGMVQTVTRQSNWLAPNVPMTSYIFVALFFWFFCFSMSKYSRSMEKKLQLQN